MLLCYLIREKAYLARSRCNKIMSLSFKGMGTKEMRSKEMGSKGMGSEGMGKSFPEMKHPNAAQQSLIF